MVSNFFKYCMDYGIENFIKSLTLNLMLVISSIIIFVKMYLLDTLVEILETASNEVRSLRIRVSCIITKIAICAKE